jgi:hypothetical protein
MGKQRINDNNARQLSRSRPRDEELVLAKSTHQDDRKFGI